MANAVYLGRLPAAGARVILPLGDSITVGTGGGTNRGGYREQLFRRAAASGSVMRFVGNAAPTGPEQVAGAKFPREHAGNGGYKTTDISGSVAVPNLNAYQPDIVLLHVGTNDIAPLNPTDVANAPANLAALLDLINATRAACVVYMSTIIPYQDATVLAAIQTYNAAMTAIAAARSFVRLLDIYSAFVANANWATEYMTDQAHPNMAGYNVMGDCWFNAIR